MKRQWIDQLELRRLLSSVINASLAPVGLTPQEVSRAYSFDSVEFQSASGKTVAGDGAGQTIAIVTAYADPAIGRDLRVFDKQFGISNQAARGGFALTIAQPQGKPKTNADWAQETALDVEWAHAMAPAARILLVETKSDAPADLFAGVNAATHRRGVTVVSMSWGWDSAPAGIDYADIFATPTGHVGAGKGDGITFVEAGGDDGSPTAFPDASVNVVSVGGTTLALDSSGNYVGETALAASAASDTVAYDADPASGFAVYDGVADKGVVGWQLAGGTSAGAPQWAALFAIVDQGRALLKKHALDGVTQTLPELASAPASDFHVIANAGASTGRGSPFADRLIATLVQS